jgi:hypothetical protein
VPAHHEGQDRCEHDHAGERQDAQQTAIASAAMLLPFSSTASP